MTAPTTQKLLKAREHYALYLEDVKIYGERKATWALAKRFCEEVYILAQIRGYKGKLTASTIQSIFREIGQKWRAVCRLDPGLDPAGLKILMQKAYPMFTNDMSEM